MCRHVYILVPLRPPNSLSLLLPCQGAATHQQMRLVPCAYFQPVQWPWKLLFVEMIPRISSGLRWRALAGIGSLTRAGSSRGGEGRVSGFTQRGGVPLCLAHTDKDRKDFDPQSWSPKVVSPSPTPQCHALDGHPPFLLQWFLDSVSDCSAHCPRDF